MYTTVSRCLVHEQMVYLVTGQSKVLKIIWRSLMTSFFLFYFFSLSLGSMLLDLKLWVAAYWFSFTSKLEVLNLNPKLQFIPSSLKIFFTNLFSISQGFRRIFNVSGGIHAYALKADQTVPTYWSILLGIWFFHQQGFLLWPLSFWLFFVHCPSKSK